jgi:hypothetical protein
MQTKIEIVGRDIVVTGPYNQQAINRWRTVCGRYSDGQWTLPETVDSQAAVHDLFGSSDEEVVARVHMDHPEVKGTYSDTLTIGGYVLARRRFRDRPVQLAIGVHLMSGTWDGRGGSAKSPRVTWSGRAPIVELEMRRDFAEEHGLEIIGPITNETGAEPAPDSDPQGCTPEFICESAGRIARRCLELIESGDGIQPGSKEHADLNWLACAVGDLNPELATR